MTCLTGHSTQYLVSVKAYVLQTQETRSVYRNFCRSILFKVQILINYEQNGNKPLTSSTPLCSRKKKYTSVILSNRTNYVKSDFILVISCVWWYYWNVRNKKHLLSSYLSKVYDFIRFSVAFGVTERRYITHPLFSFPHNHCERSTKGNQQEWRSVVKLQYRGAA